MKSVITIFLALFAIAGFAQADQILIYRGYEGQRTNFGDNEHRYYYLLFDLTSLQEVAVEHGGPVDTVFYYSVGKPTRFVYMPISTGANASATCLASGSTYVSNTFSLKFSLLTGSNSQQTLGGSLAGKYPATLSYVSYDRSGDGTNEVDKTIDDVGLFDLAVDLTQESNTSNDDLPTATAIVTDLLKSDGFAPE